MSRGAVATRRAVRPASATQRAAALGESELPFTPLIQHNTRFRIAGGNPALLSIFFPVESFVYDENKMIDALILARLNPMLAAVD